MTVIYRYEGESIPYTPGGAVTAGDVVVQNGLVGVAKLDIAAGQLGSLSICGVFEWPKGAGAGTDLAVGDLVYWDATAGFATVNSGGGANPLIGPVVEAAGDAATVVRALLSPQGAAGASSSLSSSSGS